MQAILNDVDEEWFVGYAKAQRFIEESGIRAQTLRQLFKERGLCIFAFKQENLGQICPFFMLNYTNAELLNSLAGIKIYPSVGGFYIHLEEDKTLEEIKEILSSVPSHDCEEYDVRISELEFEGDQLKAKLIYKYERSTKLFFPESPIHVNINILKTDDPKKFIVYGEIFRYLDFSKMRTFFTFNYFKDYFKLIDLNFSKIETSEEKHELIKKQISVLESVELVVDDDTTNFEILGTYEHRASRVEDLAPLEAVSYFQSSNRFNTETDLMGVETLVDQLEKQAGKRLSYMKCVYYSESQKYLSVAFYYDTYFFVTYNSVYLHPTSTEELEHPKSKDELYNFPRKVLQKDEISKLLATIWVSSAKKMYEAFNEEE